MSEDKNEVRASYLRRLFLKRLKVFKYFKVGSVSSQDNAAPAEQFENSPAEQAPTPKDVDVLGTCQRLVNLHPR